MNKEFDFNDLSNKSSQIVNKISSFSSPIGLSTLNIERNLQEIGDTSKHLNEVTSSRTLTNPLESNILQDAKITTKYALEQKQFTKNLASINTSSFTGVETIPTDIDGYLKDRFEYIIFTAIGDIQKKTSKEFQTHYEETSIHDWNKDKKYLEEILGQKYIKTNQPFGASQYGQSSLMRSGFGGGSSSQFRPTATMNGGLQSQFRPYQSTTTPIGGNINSFGQSTYIPMDDGRTKLSNKMKKYADIIQEFDIHMADESKTSGFPLVHRLKDAMLSEGSSSTSNVVHHAWGLLLSLTNEVDSGTLDQKTQTVRHQPKQPSRPSVVELVKRSVSFLESQFCQVIENRLPKNSNISLPLNIILAYIKSLNLYTQVDSDNESYDGCSIWCIVFYLMRCGYHSEAQNFALEKCGSRYMDILLPIFNDRYKSQGCTKEQRERIMREFNTAKTESKDAFKISVFNLLATGDSLISKQQAVISIQDYIWWKLNFIGSVDSGNQQQQTQLLENLQTDVKSIIEKNKANFDNLEVFQMLLAIQQFEDAVASLYQANTEDALHIAIALDYYRLLRTSTQTNSVYQFNINNNSVNQYQQQQKLQQQQSQQEIYDFNDKSIRLVSMIKQYTKRFSFEESREALFYYLLITDNNIKIREISELVVSSTNSYKFAQELSTFSEFINKQQWRTIIEQSALELENKNNYQGAIEFWLMIEEYARVLEIYNSRISILLTTISSERDQLYQFGKGLFINDQTKLKTTTTARTSYLAFEQLLKLCDFFDFFNKGKYTEALEKIENLDILPLEESKIDAKVQDYRFLSPHITRNFSSIIQAYADIIIKQYNLLKSYDDVTSNQFNSGVFSGRKESIQNYQSRIQCIALFAGKIDFPMSSNILPRLMNYFISMPK
ncbi:hypothetical protein DICPUDRAFT_148035 [Dictyostelium purpureum]|uniref:Nuclear pore protein n=1 Tax=Dictyostelium purpureum TaxID=5786 RepID=F0ZA26_DICPU|nr:uncharacterized protein DICPUDRAFT_148035 [Dictyostelium purpureum]EGC39221.1 hypothetical protein DICPUDRAFT_148035 [Dictyostelium purpureum]|eukprot:XP_003284248.1 hypothetical protein DICPUDRAFT_148035 [Dictyostelium purpureum]